MKTESLNDIKYQFTLSYTPQQNGMSERKNKMKDCKSVNMPIKG